jgi:hypothetical protein
MSVSPESTLVIVLGASRFPNLPEHMSNPAFRTSAAEFRRYLLDEHGFGLVDENLLDLFDSPAGPFEQDDKIVHFLKRRVKELQASKGPARDLIVYYVGHGGFFLPHDQYFLALACTKAGAEAISGYPIHALAVTLKEHTPQLRHYLILDCCFSAAAYQAFMGSGPMEVARKKTEEELPAKGTALLCAASPRDPAKAPLGQNLTMFSGVLLEVLWKGASDLPERLSLAEVGRCAEELVRKRFIGVAVRPEVHSPDQQKGDVAKIPLFPNNSLAAKVRPSPGKGQPPLNAREPPRPPEPKAVSHQNWTSTSERNVFLALGVGAPFVLIGALVISVPPGSNVFGFSILAFGLIWWFAALMVQLKIYDDEHFRKKRIKSEPYQKAFRAAAASGEIESMREKIIEGIDIDCSDDMGETALMKAVENGQSAAVKLLLMHGASRDTMNQFGQTAAMIAELKGYRDIIKLLNPGGPMG